VGSLVVTARFADESVPKSMGRKLNCCRRMGLGQWACIVPTQPLQVSDVLAQNPFFFGPASSVTSRLVLSALYAVGPLPEEAIPLHPWARARHACPGIRPAAAPVSLCPSRECAVCHLGLSGLETSVRDLLINSSLPLKMLQLSQF